MPNIGIIDIGIGNIFSLKQAVSHSGGIPIIINKPVNLDEIDGVILPGVGSFEYAMSQLKEKKIDIWIHDLVKNKVPLLGICLGMQLLFDKGFEGETEVKGLGVFRGSVVKISSTCSDVKLPNMGWRTIRKSGQSCFEKFLDFSTNKEFYFMHSFHVKSDHKFDTKYVSTYGGIEILSLINYKNIVSSQFHPEKSGDMGLALIKNFFEL